MNARHKHIKQLYLDNYATLLRLATAITGDADVAHDTVQEVFVNIYTSPCGDVGRGYLVNAVRNRALNHIKSLTARERLLRLLPADEMVQDGDWPDPTTLTRLSHLLDNGLDARQRQLVEMRYWQRLTLAEIGRALGILPQAVHKQLTVIIDTLRENLN